MTEYLVFAEMEVDRDAFEQLNVEEALESRKEELIDQDSETVTMTVNRTINADTEDEAKELAHDGKLLPNVPHEVTEIKEIRNDTLL